MSDFQPGDRVVLRGTGVWGANKDGKTGRITTRSRYSPTAWFVQVTGDEVAYDESQMEHAFEVGDRAVLLPSREPLGISTDFNGQTGVVVKNSISNNAYLLWKAGDKEFLVYPRMLCPLRKETPTVTTAAELNDQVWSEAQKLKGRIASTTHTAIDNFLTAAGITPPEIRLPAANNSVIWVEARDGLNYALHRTGSNGWLSTRAVGDVAGRYLKNDEVADRLVKAKKWTVLR